MQGVLQVVFDLPEDGRSNRQPDSGGIVPQPDPLDACLHPLQDRE